MLIRDARPEDDEAIQAIYAPIVADTAISFELSPPDRDEIRRRVRTVQQQGDWIVAEDDGAVLGYAYDVGFRTRPAYEATRETTVYVHAGHLRRGIARTLMVELLARLRARDVHVVVAGIALPNPASIELHRSLGFNPVGTFREIGRKFDRWHDVSFWTLPL